MELKVPEALAKALASIGDPAKIIDQTLLRPEAGPRRYERFVEESDPLGFRALVVPLSRVGLVSGISRTPVATVAGFPHGSTSLEAKIFEVEAAASRGAREVDVVIDVGLAQEGLWDLLSKEVEAIVGRARALGLGCKIILETGYLSSDQVVAASRIAARAGADYVKTSTGFGPRGASVEDVMNIRRGVEGSRTGVKASGGIRSLWDLAVMVVAGADIVGTSSGLEIVEQFRKVRRA